MSSLFLLMTCGGSGMCVVTCIAMAVGLVHAFMQDLGFLPAVLRAGGGQDEDGGDGGGEGGFFHEWDGKGSGILGLMRRCAMTFSRGCARPSLHGIKEQHGRRGS